MDLKKQFMTHKAKPPIWETRDIGAHLKEKFDYVNRRWRIINHQWFTFENGQWIPEAEFNATFQITPFIAETKIDIRGKVTDYSTIQKK